MSAIVVLGVHRSGTSAVSALLHHVGVNMGTEFLAPDQNNLKGYFEDVDFLWINKGLLEAAGGSWYNPPEREEIYDIRGKFMKNLVKTVNRKQKAAGSGMWGWKDPRTCLTIDLYYPWLEYPKIIHVSRSKFDTINSLQNLKTEARFNPADLCQKYELRINEFIHRVDPDYLSINYGRLTSHNLSGGEIMKISRFLGIPARKFHDVYNVIDIKK